VLFRSQTLLVDAHKGDLPKRAMLALDNERRALVATEEMADVTQTAVTNEAIQTYFENNYLNGEATTEYKAAHILVETEEEAQALGDDLKDGADFAELAKAKSTGPSGPGGGELGWFSDGMMVQSFQDAVTKMAPGDISGPVQTQFGWHVIKLEETRVKDAPKLEDVRTEIEQALTQKAIEARIAELTEAGNIDRSAGDAMDPAVLTQFDLLDE
jgi:peptidyl-prolyl cis-trans isomerase C